MNAVPRMCSSHLLATGVFKRIAFVFNPRLFSSKSDDGGAVKKKADISSLLKSFKQTDNKVNLNLENVLQREKPAEREESQDIISKTSSDASDPGATITASGDEKISTSLHHFSKTSRDTSDTLAGVYSLSKDPEQPISQDMNNKLKSILSKLKVDSSKSQLSRDIIGAAKSWGRSGPRSRKDIQHDFEMQSQPEAVPTRVSHVISFTSGPKFNLFDDIFKNNFPGKEPLPQLKLLEGEEMETLEKHRSLDQRNEFLTLIENADRQWKFPIDNEACKVEEESVSFEEHVFLGYLLDDFPKKGPVRRFIELVVNGLEQNPFMTVEQKRNQVAWFKNYFESVPEEDLSF